MKNTRPDKFTLSLATEPSSIQDDDILSLFDPFSLKPIKIPAKSRKCKHAQCFDLDVFLNYNDSKNTAECTVCYQYVEKEDIFIDEYFK